ncbi:MAG TPA: hypothetical protein PLV68_15240, partial [Ilumatobacteraceae bacterium]|nr:hypothetical protein [Ilumatobacteraceae bacterium]
ILMLDAAERRTDPTPAALLHLLALNGSRIGELLALDVTDIVTRHRWRIMRMATRKDGSPNDFSLAARTATAVDRAIDGRTI